MNTIATPLGILQNADSVLVDQVHLRFSISNKLKGMQMPLSTDYHFLQESVIVRLV